MPVESHSHSGVCTVTAGSRIAARGIASSWRSISLTLVRALVTAAMALNSPPAMVVGTLIWRTDGAFIGGVTPLMARILSMSSTLRTSLARQSCTALAARACSVAAMTASRGVCGGIASKVATQREPRAFRIFSIASVCRLRVPLTIRNARAARRRSTCATTASAAGRPKTTSSMAPKTTRPLCTTIILPGLLALCSLGNNLAESSRGGELKYDPRPRSAGAAQTRMRIKPLGTRVLADPDPLWPNFRTGTLRAPEHFFGIAIMRVEGGDSYMKRCLLIGFAACAFALAPTLSASAMPVATPDALGGSDEAVIQVKGGHGHGHGHMGRGGHGHHYGWGRGRGHPFGWRHHHRH